MNEKQIKSFLKRSYYYVVTQKLLCRPLQAFRCLFSELNILKTSAAVTTLSQARCSTTVRSGSEQQTISLLLKKTFFVIYILKIGDFCSTSLLFPPTCNPTKEVILRDFSKAERVKCDKKYDRIRPGEQTDDTQQFLCF